jgi:asparagine synthetase B (glutamine-hydrolysing)
MSKICGFISSGLDPKAASQQLAQMASLLRHTPQASVLSEHLPGGGIALVTNPSSVGSQLTWNHDRSRCLGLIGHASGPNVDTARQDPAETAAAMWRLLDEPDYRGFERLSGAFAVVGWDSASGTLRLAGNRFGLAPLYYYSDQRVFAFASEVKAILAIVGPQELDWQSAADFFYIGHLVGQETLFKSIRTMLPGEVLTVRAGGVSARRYFTMTDLPVMDHREVSTQKLATLFTEAVARTAWRDQRHTLLLSGGFDSRMTLGTLCELGVRPRCVALEHAAEKAGADGKLAQLAARAVGIECELHPTRPDYTGSPDWLEVFYIIDGMLPNHDLFISQVYPELETSSGVIWDGLCLGTALGGTGVRSSGSDEGLNWLWAGRRLRRKMLKMALTPEAFHALNDEFEPRTRDELARFSAGENRFQNFFVAHRQRRRAGLGTYQLYTSKGEVVTAGMDRDFLDYALAVPESLKAGHRLSIEILRQHHPALARVPVISGSRFFAMDSGDVLPARPQTPSAGRLARPLRRAGRASGNLLRSVLPGQADAICAEPSSRLIVQVLERRMFDRPIYNRRLLLPLFAAFRRGNSALYRLFDTVFYIELWHLLFLDSQSDLLFNPRGLRAATQPPAPTAA